MGRPRKIEEDYLRVSEGHIRPTARRSALFHLRTYGRWLRDRGIDSDAVTIQTLVDFQNWLQARPGGYTTGPDAINGSVRSYYSWKGSAEPEGRWATLAQQISILRKPEVLGEVEPYEAFPLALLPKILDAAKHVVQVNQHGDPIYNEAYALTATFLYTGGRAQFYGITDEQVRAALEKKYIQLFVKGGRKQVKVPVHDRLLEIWKEHLEKRDFDGPAFFRNGRNPYTYHDGNKDWTEDSRASGSNVVSVCRILRGPALNSEAALSDGVEHQLEILYGVKDKITSHRFRKSVVTYMELYGFTEAERRLQVSHGAETITQKYSDPNILEAQRKISTMDLGSAEWVAAHDPPGNLFVSNGDANMVAELRHQLADERARSDRLEKKLDQLLARFAPKVIA